MLVQVREGSSAQNLDTILPLLASGEIDEAWCLVTDDVFPDRPAGGTVISMLCSGAWSRAVCRRRSRFDMPRLFRPGIMVWSIAAR